VPDWCPLLDERLREQALEALLAIAEALSTHMHAIRLLRGAAKQHEIVLYELLLRAYAERARRTAGVAT